jgi:4-amino-4-deoxy-L-arabinose transferase-like glycosyltransferase
MEGFALDRDRALRLLLLIAVLAAGVRFLDLGSNPPEFFEDELSGAVSAWSIATTGHDVERTTLPFLRTRLELKQPLYFWLAVPFRAVFGPSPFIARVPAALLGILTVLLIAWLVRVAGGGWPEAVLAAGITAVLPWAIHYSRAGWEPAALLPFSILGVGCLWRGLESKRVRWTIAAAVLAIGAYAYHPALLMNVALAVLVVAIQARRIGRRDLLGLAGGGLVAALILVPYALALSDPLFLQRTGDISIFRAGVNPLATAWTNYWDQWNPAYLFFDGAPNPRINPGQVVYPWLVPFLVIGVVGAVRRGSRADWLFVGWLVLGPLAAAITFDQTEPSYARGLETVPPLVILSAFGLVAAGRWLTTRFGSRAAIAGATVLAVVALGSGALWAHWYFDEYPIASASWWGYGTANAFAMTRANVPSNGTLCIAENDVSGLTYPQHIAYYLPDAPFRTLEGLDHPECRAPGTYVLSLTSRTLDTPSRDVASVPDIHGQPYFSLRQVTGG